ncbi:autophagy-related protein 13 homolog [Plodia interpunctella]|uniref:autophagy-related protein 13 homolog n=1 Tax=Plodia interpunctella TaxID=58824 RepID=UPI002368C07E|nr:autophagy-related protein 13 homolog [Plodia interpunctella]
MGDSAKFTEADRLKLYKFIKILTLKVAQIVVQSRQGKKITQDYNSAIAAENGQQPNLQWFNLSIPDEPEVNQDTDGVLNGEVVDALTKVFCIEISLRTSDGEGMVLELWTVKIIPSSADQNSSSVTTIYYRMSIMLKSTLSISRVTPAYKMSRSQHKESYKILHKIYGGEPNIKLLGENYKHIKVSELRTPLGTILIEVVYRTKMTMLPEDKIKSAEAVTSSSTVSDIMVKSDHFFTESPKRANQEKKEIDLSKPLTAGAFVDEVKIRELHDALSQQLPPEPPMTWLLAETDKIEKKMKNLTTAERIDNAKPGSSGEAISSAPHPPSKAIEVPRAKNGDKYSSLMDFPFADGSPMADLANFYQECVQARSVSDEWTDLMAEASASTDSDSLSQQLKMFEEAVPEFDNMVASMLSTSENSE